MNINNRFASTPPLEVSNVQSATITTSKGVILEIVDRGDGVYIRCDNIPGHLVVVPHASNAVKLLSSKAYR